MRLLAILLLAPIFLFVVAGCDDHTRPRTKKDSGAAPKADGMMRPPADGGPPPGGDAPPKRGAALPADKNGGTGVAQNLRRVSVTFHRGPEPCAA